MKRLLSAVPVAVTVAVVALLGLLAYGVASKEPDNGLETALARGERPPAPAVELPRLDGGGQAELASYRGQVVVLNYWASWCGPCRDESPLLERWHRKLKREGATVLGIDVRDATSDAQDFVRRYGLTYPMLRDGSGESQKEFGVLAYPETVVIDRRGRIRALERGPVDDAFFEERVLPVLEEPA